MRAGRPAGCGAGTGAPGGEVMRWPSAGVDVDGYGCTVRDDVEHGRSSAGLLDYRAQLLGVVAAQSKAHPDLLVAVADLVRQPEDAQQVNVALDGRGDLGESDAAGGGDGGDTCGEAGDQGVQQVLGRCRAVVLADQHGRVVGGEGERLAVGD